MGTSTFNTVEGKGVPGLVGGVLVTGKSCMALYGKVLDC